MKKQTDKRKELPAINIADDNEMVTSGLRHKSLRLNSTFKNKDKVLTDSQRKNISALGISVTEETKEKDVLKTLKKRKKFKMLW